MDKQYYLLEENIEDQIRKIDHIILTLKKFSNHNKYPIYEPYH